MTPSERQGLAAAIVDLTIAVGGSDRFQATALEQRSAVAKLDGSGIDESALVGASVRALGTAAKTIRYMGFLLAELADLHDRSASPQLWDEPEWLAIVSAYGAVAKRRQVTRPAQIDVAQEMGFDTEQPIRDRLRALGIGRWTAVHALIAARPDTAR